jgi:hypothetical protein
MRLADYLFRLSDWFRPAGRVTFSLRAQRESNQRESAPHIRPRLRRGSLAPLPLQGPTCKGHPWPFTPCAASMRLIPLRGNSTRPPEGTPDPGPGIAIKSTIIVGSAISQGLRTLCLLLVVMAPMAHAFDLAQLSAQLAKPALVRGPFIQEKHLRALPQPLISEGQFVLSREFGLLWSLRSPVAQDYRIDASGIARRTPQGWLQQPGQDVAGQQSRLFLAVLQGDHSGLARDFDLQLQGTAAAWQLQLLPRSLLLKQIFSAIQIQGGALVERIELHETQGDSTLLRLPHSAADTLLSAAEQADFGH